MADRAGSVGWKFNLAGEEVKPGDIIQFTVYKALDEPQECTVVLRNTDHSYSSKAKPGETMTLKSTSPGTDEMKQLFTGKIQSADTQYAGGGESRIVVRGYCLLFDKKQGKKSHTYQDKTDQQMIQDVLGNIEFQGPDEKPAYKHVYVPNKSDLEFALLRATRMGCYIWSDDGKIKVQKPKFEDSGIEFYVYENEGKKHRMKNFRPSQNTSAVIKSMKVQAWDPEKKEPIVGEAKAEPSKLGSKEAASAAGDAAKETFCCDEPVFSKEEATMVAKAKLMRHNLQYMRATAEAFGSAEYKPGIVVKVFINSQQQDRYDGGYFVTATTHKYSHGSQTNPDGGYSTHFILQRNAEVQ